jgi:exoribonuclease II
MYTRRPSWKREDTPSLIGIIRFGERRITIESGDESYYVHPPRASGYIHGDTVGFTKSRVAKDGKMAEAKPLKLIKRSQEEVIVEVQLGKK